MIDRQILPEDRVFEAAGEQLVQLIAAAAQPCLVLLSGGSAIASYKQLVRYINSGRAGSLMIGLVDERYGEVGHTQSNALAIEEQTGLFSQCEKHNVVYRTILAGGSMAEDVERYERWLVEAFHLCPTRLAVLGMGVDGHTAGILPQSLEAFTHIFGGQHLVVGYESFDKYAGRITVSPTALNRLTGALLVIGKSKRTVVTRLTGSEQIAPWEMPAVIIRQIPHVWLFEGSDLGQV